MGKQEEDLSFSPQNPLLLLLQSLLDLLKHFLRLNQLLLLLLVVDVQLMLQIVQIPELLEVLVVKLLQLPLLPFVLLHECGLHVRKRAETGIRSIEVKLLLLDFLLEGFLVLLRVL